MSNLFFQFKQFTVWHDKCAMKVGTDGVLLGAWADVENTFQILDVGTGTGSRKEKYIYRYRLPETGRDGKTCHGRPAYHRYGR